MLAHAWTPPLLSGLLERMQREHLERSFRRTADMLRWLPEKLGTPFPYPKYFQIALPFVGGAMENISLVTWDDRFVLDAELERDERQLLDVINVHEMAHTWFGDLVVCRDFAHAWLKESWATYMEACWLEHDLGHRALPLLEHPQHGRRRGQPLEAPVGMDEQRRDMTAVDVAKFPARVVVVAEEQAGVVLVGGGLTEQAVDRTEQPRRIVRRVRVEAA